MTPDLHPNDTRSFLESSDSSTKDSPRTPSQAAKTASPKTLRDRILPGGRRTGGIAPKTKDEIERMRIAGRLAAEVLDMIEAHVQPGVTTAELDALCHRHIVEVQNAIPAPLNYHGFPKSICTSVNHQVCHGIPGEKRLKSGDIVNVDITVIKDGLHGDTSRMLFVGEPSVAARRLCRVAREAMEVGIETVRPGIRLGDLGHAIAAHVRRHGYSIVEEYCGHGIGYGFHEEPQILHFGSPGSGLVIEEGWTFTIEPMVNAGKRHVKLLRDGWTVVTKDRSLSAQWEHTILVTASGCEILTLSEANRSR
ncbi:MAG: type I methionyl aminopeptidase [Ectothiorhodospiraceae bacterium AqS1]|nr:type I methionyl aminopeptidase [Ectothiorhodospiraceae bacterium AqS1]